MILAEIKEKLLEIDPIVFYGAVNPNEIETVWDYIVFERKVTKPSTNQTGYSHYFTVHIIRENFVPEGLELTVIEKMKEIGEDIMDTDVIWHGPATIGGGVSQIMQDAQEQITDILCNNKI